MALPMMMTPSYLPTIEDLSGEELQARRRQLNLESVQGLKNEAGPLAAPQIGKGTGVYSIGNRTQPLPTLAPEPVLPMTNPNPPGEEGIPARGTVSVVPPEYFTKGPTPAMSRELSAARFAAADRGDWKALAPFLGTEAAPKLAPPNLAAYPDTLQGRHDRNVALHQYELEQKQANIGVEQGIKTKEQAAAEQAAKATMYGHTLTAQTERAKELRAEREFGQTPKQIGEELVPSDVPGLPPVVLKKFGILNPVTGKYEEVSGGISKPAGPEPLPNHVAALKAGKVTPQQFDEKYGAGASKRYQGS